MPPLRLVPPEELKQVLEEDGFKVIFENEYHWFLAKGLKGVPLNIPKEPGEDGCVSMEIMEHTLFEAQISHHKYFALRDLISNKGKKDKDKVN